jgi:hypothetical protein
MNYSVFREKPHDPFKIVDEIPDSLFPGVLRGHVAILCAWLFPVELVREVGGFSETIHYGEDWDFVGRVACAGANLKRVQFIGAFHRKHGASQTANTLRRDRERERLDVLANLVAELRLKPELTDARTDDVFWAGWVTLQSAACEGVERDCFNRLCREVDLFLRCRRPARSWRAKCCKWLGTRLVFDWISVMGSKARARGADVHK